MIEMSKSTKIALTMYGN